MACSAVTLSLSTIISVLAVACLAIAFSTDNWYEIRVDRNRTEERLMAESGGGLPPVEFETDARYFSRDEGLFRVCFAYGVKPKGLETYTSPTQTQCTNVDYHIPDDEQSDKFGEQRWERLHMARAVVALFVVAFFFLLLSFFTGIAGCWKRSHANLVSTGILQLLAALMDAGAMGLWHAVRFYDQHKLKDEWSYDQWPEVLKEAGVTEFIYGWSYILAWLGVGLSLFASILFLSAARCIRNEKCAEQAKNMQYLMPVYPDKRNPYGYAYAYPGPYAYGGGAGGGGGGGGHHPQQQQQQQQAQYGAGPYGY